VLTRCEQWFGGRFEHLDTPNKASIRLAKRRDSRGFNWTYSRVLCLGIAGNIVVQWSPSDIHHIGAGPVVGPKCRIRVIEHSTR
jgi:hypothetical protein